MLMSDVLGVSVFDPAGQPIGRISDVRLVQDGPYLDGFGNALRVDAVVVGRGGIASRLGYIRGGVRGPWLLKALASALEGRAHVITWTDLQRTEQGFTTNRSRRELERLGDSSGPAP
jgi:hypothetical protein